MNRRKFLQSAAAAGGALLLRPAWAAEPAPALPVKTVYAVFKCHLDIGFADTQEAIIHRYFDRYFPQAMDIAASLRAAGGRERYVWTTGSWLVYKYLEQATPAQAQRMTQAFADGDLAWHGIPFNWETEMLDLPLLEASLGLSKSLDKRFGRKTTGAKMTDVPGHSRGLVGPLAKAGITFLDIGVNPASSYPQVPPVFRWRNPEGAEIVVLYHQHDYGSTLTIPGSDIAVSVNVRGDNSGPHSVDEIKRIYADLGSQFPGAKIVACSLSTVADAIAPYRAGLPVVTQEIGDTWVYGCASDPIKVAQYRELSRLRQEWIAEGKMKPNDAADMAWLPSLTLASEHTWGCDIKSNLGDWGIYTPAEVQAALGKPNFVKTASTWAEKRNNNRDAVAALPPALRDQAQARLAKLAAAPPDMQGLKPLAVSEEIHTRHFILALDPATGAIVRLQNRRTGREWASAAHPLGLFSYQTFSAADYKRFESQYITIQTDWAPLDFGKPGLDKYPAQSRLWQPVHQETHVGRVHSATRIITELHMPDAGDQAPLVAWPGRMILEMTLPDDDPSIHLQFQWFGKIANRLPEALWLSFTPIAPSTGGWTFDKVNQPVSPQDVVSHGGRNMHAVTGLMTYQDPKGKFLLNTLDAPVVAPGQMSLLNFTDQQPDMSGGVHVSLFNNTWGTNYVMWLSDDVRTRFVLRA